MFVYRQNCLMFKKCLTAGFSKLPENARLLANRISPTEHIILPFAGTGSIHSSTHVLTFQQSEQLQRIILLKFPFLHSRLRTEGCNQLVKYNSSTHMVFLLFEQGLRQCTRHIHIHILKTERFLTIFSLSLCGCRRAVISW